MEIKTRGELTIAPGECFFCGTGNREVFVDPGKFMKGHGAVYICSLCVDGMTTLLGTKPPYIDPMLLSASGDILDGLKKVEKFVDDHLINLSRYCGSIAAGHDAYVKQVTEFDEETHRRARDAEIQLTVAAERIEYLEGELAARDAAIAELADRLAPVEDSGSTSSSPTADSTTSKPTGKQDLGAGNKLPLNLSI